MQRDRGGVRRTYDVSIFPIASPDNSGAVIRIDDITQRLQVEQLMMRSEKMTMVAGLAAGMAHELNNPLGTVLQSVQNIHRRLSMELPENHLAAEEVHVALEDVHRYLERREVPDFLDAIQEAGGRAAQIISDMLSFSRTGNTEPRLVQLRHTIARAVRLVQAGYAHGNPEQAAHFEVVLDIDEEVPEVRCDENKIEQVLLNLVSNAAQALAEVDDKRPRIITIRLRSEPYAIRIDVEDNGPGMSDEVRQRIFEPFFTTKGGGEGTGLGLSVSYFLVVDLHGGSLEVESEPGHGACFILRLPR
jgi:signal transduction histidine kinase